MSGALGERLARLVVQSALPLCSFRKTKQTLIYKLTSRAVLNNSSSKFIMNNEINKKKEINLNTRAPARKLTRLG
jgi:hypothetical protein